MKINYVVIDVNREALSYVKNPWGDVKGKRVLCLDVGGGKVFKTRKAAEKAVLESKEYESRKLYNWASEFWKITEIAVG